MTKEQNKIIEEFEEEFSNGTENAIGQKVFSPEYDCFNGEFFLKVERFLDKALSIQREEIIDKILTPHGFVSGDLKIERIIQEEKIKIKEDIENL